MDDGEGDIREEARRVNDRFFLGVLLNIITEISKRAAGLKVSVSDRNLRAETMKNGGHVAFYCASELNFLASLCFMFVILRIGLIILGFDFFPVGMLRLREEADMKITIGFTCLMFSLVFLAYLQWFLVV